MLSCNETAIKSIWGVTYLTSSEVNHLVILLNNGTHKCTCMSLTNRGIVCRHYFSIMLRTSQAKFHIGLLNQRWLVSNQLNLKSQPFYSATKFKNDLETPFLDVDTDFLNSASNDSNLSGNQYVSLSKQRQYYAHVWGLAKQANKIACKNCDESFIALLEKYISNKNREALSLEQLEPSQDADKQNNYQVEIDQENVDPIGNPIVRRPKGRPPGTTRFRGPLETLAHPNEITKSRKCGLCNESGHNRATCSMNFNRKKRKNDD